jgi:AcrR family transcriptional regulator
MPATRATSNRRDELVDLASGLFYRQGYGATGIKQIIDQAGIAKGTFYSHFSSKEELGLAWLQKRHQVWNGWLDAQIDGASSPKSKILALFDFLESWMAESNHRGCAFLNTLAEIPDPDHAMRAEIESHKLGLRTKIEALVAEHFDDKPGSFTKHRAQIIFLLFEGALVETQITREPSLIAAARKQTKTMLAHAA